MSTGMLWFDNSADTLTAKICKAADYYHKKYGRRPELCLVHPNMLKDQKLEIEGITVRPYRPVLPGHLWVGIEEQPVAKEPA